ncbi:Os09g0371625, partial [Oryza sativa Japonica Group]
SALLPRLGGAGEVGLLPPLGARERAHHHEARRVHRVDAPRGARRLAGGGAVEHRGVVVQPDGEPHHHLRQRQRPGRQRRVLPGAGAAAGGGGERGDEVHHLEHEVGDVPERLRRLRPRVRGGRRRVEEPERLQPRGRGGHGERREVDGEVRLRQQQRAAEEREVRADTPHQRREQAQRQQQDRRRRRGRRHGRPPPAQQRPHPVGDAGVRRRQVRPGRRRQPRQVRHERLLQPRRQLPELRDQVLRSVLFRQRRRHLLRRFPRFL